VTVSVYTERVLFSCKSIWMSSGGGPDPLDPPLIYATGLVEIWPDSFLVGRVRKILMLLRQFCKQRDNWSVSSRTKCLSTSPPPFSLSDEYVRSCSFKLGACLRFLSGSPSFKKIKAKAYLKKQKYYRTRSNKKKLNKAFL
jgi:hypothetical protein